MRERARALLPAALLVGLVAGVCASFWPGHVNADTLYILRQLDERDITNQHAPLLQYLWLPLWELGFGVGGVLALQIAAFVAGAFLVLRLALAPLVAALATAAVVVLAPVLGALALVGRDAWFAALVVLAFGLLAEATRRAGRGRAWLVGSAVAVAWLALAARQNAAPAVLLVLVPAAGIVLRARWGDAAPSPRRQALAATLAGAGACLALMASQLVAVAALPVRDDRPAAYTQLYDLAAISERERVNLLPADVLRDRSLRTIDRRTRVEGLAEWIYVADAPLPVAAEGWRSRLGASHRRAIRDHPLAYLAERGEQLGAQVALTGPAWTPYHAGVDPNPWATGVGFPRLHEAALDYLRAFADPDRTGSVLYRTWLYLLAALAALVVLARRRAVLGAAVAAAALVHQVGLFVTAPSVHFRYELPAVACALLGAALAAGVLVERRRSPAPASAPRRRSEAAEREAAGAAMP